MGLDIYVGSFSRYLAGDWLTVAAQSAAAEGIKFATMRPEGEPDRHDPAEIAEAVHSWQSSMAEALGVGETWDENPDAPYATDQPHWLGYGALLILAARLERPQLASADDDPAAFVDSPAFQASQQDGSSMFPSLLGGAQWWLPLRGLSATFTGSGFQGDMVSMSTLDLLDRELDALSQGLGVTGQALAEALLMGGPGVDGPESPEAAPEYLREWGVFGLAVFRELAAQAQRMQLPLLLDA